MNDPQLHRDIGRLEGRVMALETQVGDMKAELSEMKELVGEMHDAIVSAKGGWRVLVGVGAVAAALSAFITKMIGVFVR